MSFIARLKQTFDPTPAEHERPEEELKFAAAVLMMELSRADREVSETERATVQRTIAETFQMSDAEVSELVRAAEAEAEAQVSLHRYTDAIKQRWGQGEKRRLIECLWRVAFAEGGMHHYEEQLVRRLADLLHVPHREFLQARHRVEDESGGREM